MAFETQCPKCGTKDLRVIRCTVYGAFQLQPDGFVVEGHLDTEHELVECGGCGKRFTITQLACPVGGVTPVKGG